MKELWLRGVKSIAGANEVLGGGFVGQLNKKFAREPAEKEDAHRPVPAGVRLAEVFCLEEQRSVANDWVARYYNRLLQISPDNGVLPRPRDKVTVRRLLDGTVQVVYAGQVLRYEEIAAEPKVTDPHKATAQSVRAGNTPGPTHPWRQSKLFRRGQVLGGSRP